MSKFQRPESLVVFNGQDKDGRKMSYENQFRTFRSAKLVLGPHGSGNEKCKRTKGCLVFNEKHRALLTLHYLFPSFALLLCAHLRALQCVRALVKP
jgi:hypothetical protein